MINEYERFLAEKQRSVKYTGFQINSDSLNPLLFPYQRACVQWALQLGKAALFQERGLGKTIQELEFMHQVTQHTGGKCLLLAPLAVGFQTVDEGHKFGYSPKYCQDQSQVGNETMIVTNYERLHHFDASQFVGVVLDESSILKNFTGKTKTLIIDTFRNTPFKLAASATPAPNDHLELGNHAEFLDIMPSNEMIARWFINNAAKANDYRLKGHAVKDFFRWLTSFAVCLSHPRDLGAEYDIAGFDLPALNIHEHLVETTQEVIQYAHDRGELLPDSKPSSTELHRVKRLSLKLRIEMAKEIFHSYHDNEPTILWCDTNDEADALIEAFPDATEVRGSHTQKRKEASLRAFTNGEISQIITKADIAGWGLNWQHCHRQISAGVNYSFEKLYQMIGRSYRFRQLHDVDIHMIYAANEANVLSVLKEKQKAFKEMQYHMNEAIHEYGLFRGDNQRSLRTSRGGVPMIIPEWLVTHVDHLKTPTP